MGVMFDCKTTLFTEVPQCAEVITANLGVIDTNYTYVITAPSGNVYRKDVVVVGGEFDILASDFPPSMFNRWIGVLQFQLFRGNECQPVPITICGVEYDTIAIRFVSTWQVLDPESPVLLVCQCPVDA